MMWILATWNRRRNNICLHLPTNTACCYDRQNTCDDWESEMNPKHMKNAAFFLQDKFSRRWNMLEFVYGPNSAKNAASSLRISYIRF